MKFYFKPKERKFINARKLVGLESKIEELGFIDFLGKGQYNIQNYHVLVYDDFVIKTKSDNKANSYQLQGYTLVSPKGSNEILEDYLMEEVEIHEQV